jgi:hypothetical protein
MIWEAMGGTGPAVRAAVDHDQQPIMPLGETSRGLELPASFE